MIERHCTDTVPRGPKRGWITEPDDQQAHRHATGLFCALEQRAPESADEGSECKQQGAQHESKPPDICLFANRAHPLAARSLTPLDTPFTDSSGTMGDKVSARYIPSLA